MGSFRVYLVHFLRIFLNFATAIQCYYTTYYIIGYSSNQQQQQQQIVISSRNFPPFPKFVPSSRHCGCPLRFFLPRVSAWLHPSPNCEIVLLVVDLPGPYIRHATGYQ